MATYKEVYRGLQKKAKQSKITAFNQEYGHHSSESQRMFLCILIINLQTGGTLL